MSDLLTRVVDRALDEIDRRNRTSEYFNRVDLWAKYMLDVDLWSKQREIADDLVHNKNVAVKAGHGVGKVLAADTPVAARGGWITARDLRVGDEIYDEQGETTRVVGLSPVWDQRNFEITFDDGSTIEAGEQHEWDVLDLTRRSLKEGTKSGVQDWREMWHTAVRKTTLEMFTEGIRTRSDQYRWRVPMAKPLQMPEAELPIDPYLLGFWLGDGTRTTGQITIGKSKAGLTDWLDRQGYDYSLHADWENGRASVTPKGLKVALRGLGMLDNKHIPMAYLRASESQRRELLAGLMDADGFLLKNQDGASVGIDMTDERLSQDIYDLLMTLGCKVRWSESDAAYTLDGERHITGTRYRMNWTPLENPFKIRGTQWRVPGSQRSRHTQRTIVSIVEKGRLENFCIEVDSPSHLYLAGRSLIPTHNSFLVAVLICHWIDTRYPNAFVASTAPSTAQIGGIVWREIRKQYAIIAKRYKNGDIDHALPGYITADNQWKTEGGTILGFGRKPPDNKEDDAFQGLHDAYVLAVGDEAVGLTEEMIDALGNITSNANSRRILIANPTNPASYFAKIFKDDNGAWKLHTISVFDSPNFTDEKNHMTEVALASLTDQSYVDDKRKEYGENSPRYKARVLGEFAWDLGDTLIKPEHIARGVETEVFVEADMPVILGVDIARFGEDNSVIHSNTGGKVRFVDEYKGEGRVTDTAAWVHRWAIDLNATEVRVDALGIGGGVVDNLLTFENVPYTLIAMNSSGASPDPKQWHNARAFWWDSFRKDLMNGKIDIEDSGTSKHVERLHDELQSVEYKFAPKGGLLIESKDDMRKRGVKSPDFGDSAIFSYADMSWLFDASPQVGDKLTANVEQLLENYTDEPWWA